MKWNQFAHENNFEQLVLTLTERSIELVLASDLPEKDFSAFAFNCSSFSGDISLSFGIDPGYEDKQKQHRLYPPDWEYEVMESSIPQVGALWKAKYDPVRSKFAVLQESVHESDREFEDFGNGFLDALRKVMIHLEMRGSLSGFGSKPMWTLVTEIDADTSEEEHLLQCERERQQRT